MDTVTSPTPEPMQSERTAVVTVTLVCDGVSRQIRLPERLTPDAACNLLIALVRETGGELEDVPF